MNIAILWMTSISVETVSITCAVWCPNNYYCYPIKDSPQKNRDTTSQLHGDKLLIKQFDEGVKKMRHSGEFQQILDR